MSGAWKQVLRCFLIPSFTHPGNTQYITSFYNTWPRALLWFGKGVVGEKTHFCTLKKTLLHNLKWDFEIGKSDFKVWKNTAPLTSGYYKKCFAFNQMASFLCVNILGSLNPLAVSHSPLAVSHRYDNCSEIYLSQSRFLDTKWRLVERSAPFVAQTTEIQCKSHPRAKGIVAFVTIGNARSAIR